MTDNNIRDLIASDLQRWLDLSDGAAENAARVVLATRIPWLCPDCNDQGWSTTERPYPQPCFHPNAPTVASLLAIGEAVVTAKEHFDRVWVKGAATPTPHATAVLAALRAAGEVSK